MAVTNHSGARSPEFAILGFFFEHPGYGYNLHQQLESELGHVWHVSQSQTYAIIKRLVAQGFLCSTMEERDKLPARQLLQITPPGRERFEEWLSKSAGSSVRAIRLEFITRIYFAQKIFPGMLMEMFSIQIKEVSSAITRMKKIRNSIPPEQTFNAMGLDLRIQQLTSILTWLYESQAKMGKITE